MIVYNLEVFHFFFFQRLSQLASRKLESKSRNSTDEKNIHEINVSGPESSHSGSSPRGVQFIFSW